MIIARWQIDAKFGHKPEVTQAMKRWFEEVGTQIGWKSDKTRILTGSVGAPESTIVAEVELDSLATLNESFEKLGQIDAHKQWGRDLEPNVVSGSNRWEVYRTI